MDSEVYAQRDRDCLDWDTRETPDWFSDSRLGLFEQRPRELSETPASLTGRHLVAPDGDRLVRPWFGWYGGLSRRSSER